jgi:Family of unknown function (DUF5695)
MDGMGWLTLPGVLVACAVVPVTAAQAQRDVPADTTPTLGLAQGLVSFETPDFTLALVRASQTVALLAARGADGFDFTPHDWLERRAANGYFHLGDLTLRVRRAGTDAWMSASTADARHPVTALRAEPPALAAADLAPTLPANFPLRVRRFWDVVDGRLGLRFEISNQTDAPVEIGALGFPMAFNNILTDRSLNEAHAVSSFADPYVGLDAGYLQVTRLNGHGPTLVVVPQRGTAFEAWNPLLADRTRRGITFEGFYEWLALSRAFADSAWASAEPWNPPTAVTLAPGETRSFGVRFLVANGVRDIEPTLLAAKRPVAVGVPGYVLPLDLDARLFVSSSSPISGVDVEPAGALSVAPGDTTPGGWRAFTLRGQRWGRARVTVRYADGTRQSIHYKVIRPAAQVAADLGRFLTTEQWFEDASDSFARSPSVMSYDWDARRLVTEDNRAWIAGLGDEGGSGSWLAAVMKQLVRADPDELAKLQRFVDGVLWGGLQYAEGDLAFGVRKSLFFYQPDWMPPGTYSDSVRYGGWSSWSREHARTVGRSYNYPHVAALHWVMYQLARNHEGLVTNHPWEWYLEHAYETAMAMVRFAPDHAQFGQMDGTAFLLTLLDLQREGWTAQAQALEAAMRARADHWRSLGFPFGSEMPWDSTGQEEVYAWCRYFGYDDKALVTLNAILGYMPTVPHWGYNGSARRYWDFVYAGKLRRLERQLHHYGSGLNAIPVLAEYRAHPDDLYLLRVGYGGLLGAIANVTEEGFGPSGFHAFPSTLAIDGYSGDYGPGFFGHAVTTATYVVRDAAFGWLAFGGNLTIAGDTVRVDPRDSGRRRVYVAPLGLWLTLDAGTFERVEVTDSAVRVTLGPATAHTPVARLRIERPAVVAGVRDIRLRGSYAVERGAHVIPLGSAAVALELTIGR